ncbi:diguanylate cyclase domain-containing protein [Okeania sp. SIO2B3]|uniref:GGDEF domain-containing response regulator n=1 Tax=Okeania sp. SIO2B3 TaxID=2607784 RepID=UPI0013BF9EA3|nr:diguanylate cyclase [Okeania sp. SIO2B3]NET43805.1 diguanylate cyclase [Okeania sp. SIO2B3]
MYQQQNSILRESILIINDNPKSLKLLTELLSLQGYKVQIATSGKEALENIHFELPDLILLEVKMPEMDGYQICECLKIDKQTTNIPVVFISALDGAMDKVKAFTVGGVDYITKPFELIEILARIENQLRLRSLQQQLQQQNALLQLLLKVTHAISEASDIESALEVTLAEVCQTMNWDFGEAWIPDPEATMLKFSRGWYSSNSNNGTLPATLQFRQQHQIITFSSQQSLLQRVWYSQQAEWVKDISQEKESVLIGFQIAEKIGIKSALGIPIILDKQVLAILVFFQKFSQKLDQNSIQLVNAVATQLGGLIQRKKSEIALKKANQDLKRIASFDSLTSLANRRTFDEYFHQKWEQLRQEKKYLSLILCDVDYFKYYNDFYGHPEGDQCLKKVAQAISKVAKFSTDLVCRYGGEEFGVILPNTNIEEALGRAELIRREIKRLEIPHTCSKVSPYVTVSLGVSSVIPTLNLSTRTLLIDADQALYQAKEQGRDCVIAHRINYVC